MSISSFVFWVTRLHKGTLGNGGERRCQTIKISPWLISELVTTVDYVIKNDV